MADVKLLSEGSTAEPANKNERHGHAPTVWPCASGHYTLVVRIKLAGGRHQPGDPVTQGS